LAHLKKLNKQITECSVINCRVRLYSFTTYTLTSYMENVIMMFNHVGFSDNALF